MVRVPESGSVRLHGGVASSSSWPTIEVNFNITFTRDTVDKTKVLWQMSDISRGNTTTSGGFGYNFQAYIGVDSPNAPDNEDEIWRIMNHSYTDAQSWWNKLNLQNRSGYFYSTNTTATLKIYVRSRYSSYECCQNAQLGYDWCYNNGHGWYQVYSQPVSIPAYEEFYTVTYNANGGSPTPGSQTKSSLSALTLSSTVPTYPVTITYYNSPTQTVTANRVFTNNKWLGSDSVEYAPGGSYTTNANCTMTARWGVATFTPVSIPNRYFTVTYNYNGGSGSPASVQVLRSTNGYATSSGSTTKAYTPGVSATTSTNLNLYPIYQNGTLSYSSLPTPSRAGYLFNGWYYNGSKVSSNLTVTGNITLVANWTPLPLHKFQSNGTWNNFGPKVYRFNGTSWVQDRDVYKFNGSSWDNISQ